MTKKRNLAAALERTPPPIKRGSDLTIGGSAGSRQGNSVSPDSSVSTDERDQAPETKREALPATLPAQTGSSAHWQPVLVPIDDILDSHYQSREKQQGQGTEKFQRLVRSMKKGGPDQPIKVHRHQTIPGKLQITRGGHSRVAAARVAGHTTYPVIIVEYNDEEAALGTAWENLAREDLSPLEEGELYLKIRKARGYNRDELAEELGISPDRIKECEALANSAEDIKEMIRWIKALGNDTDRGLQAAKQLRRLDALDQRKEGFAAHIRAPLINAFVYERITTSEVALAVTKLLEAEDPEDQLAALIRSIHQREAMDEGEVRSLEMNPEQAEKRHTQEPSLQLETKLRLFTRNFRVLTQLLGDTPPPDEVKQILSDIRRQIDAIMSR